MGTNVTDVDVEGLFQRSLTAHLPPHLFERVRETSVLVAGLGGGSNIAELLVRKGFGRILLADLDVFESHNIRQRGSAMSTLGREKTVVMEERLRDINPRVRVTAYREGITLENVDGVVDRSDIVIDVLDFVALREKVALYRAARSRGKTVITTPSVINGAVLFVFAPDGIPFEEFFDYEEGLPLPELGTRFLKRLIPTYPSEAPESLYLAAAEGKRTIPLDAVGVDQASVMAVAAAENLALGRMGRLIFVPKAIQVDVSDPLRLARVVDFGDDFRPWR